MKRTSKFFICLIVFLLITARSIKNIKCAQNSYWKPYSYEYFFKKLSEFEKVINKNNPTLRDYYDLYVGKDLIGDPYEKELTEEQKQCEKRQWEVNSNQCIKFTNRRAENPDISPSYYLLKLQKALKKNEKGKIFIFISPQLSNCYAYLKTTDCPLLAIDIKGVIKTGNTYKKVIFKMSCNKASTSFMGSIIDIWIGGKWIENYSVFKQKVKTNRSEINK